MLGFDPGAPFVLVLQPNTVLDQLRSPRALLLLPRALIRTSLVGCQLNVAQKRRHGSKEERNSDGPMDPDVDESEEIDMALGCEKGITATSKPAARDAHPMAPQGDCMRLARPGRP